MITNGKSWRKFQDLSIAVDTESGLILVSVTSISAPNKCDGCCGMVGFDWYLSFRMVIAVIGDDIVMMA